MCINTHICLVLSGSYCDLLNYTLRLGMFYKARMLPSPHKFSAQLQEDYGNTNPERPRDAEKE